MASYAKTAFWALSECGHVFVDFVPSCLAGGAWCCYTTTLVPPPTLRAVNGPGVHQVYLSGLRSHACFCLRFGEGVDQLQHVAH